MKHVKCFLTSDQPTTEDSGSARLAGGKELSFADKALLKRPKLEPKKPTYIDTAFVPPTSNMCDQNSSRPTKR